MINVLIVDDDYNARAGLVDLIPWKELNAHIVAALEDGEQVVQLLQKRSDIDLIILDIRMPFMDGLAVAKYIRKNAYDMDIILLSAYDEFDYAREALKYDVREYILKPISRANLNKLSETIKSVSEEKEAAIKWRLEIRVTELKEKIKSGLNSKDMQTIEELLNVENQFDNLSMKNLREYYLVFIEVLWDYYKTIGRNADVRRSLMKSFNEMSDAEAMKKFIKENFGSEICDTDYKKSGVNIVEDVKRYIDKNISDINMSPQSTASYFNLSVDYLSRLFKATKEDSLSEYIIKSKIERSKSLLSDNRLSISQIAKTLGYSDPNYFFKIFKKKTGITPMEFRIQSKKRERNDSCEG